jgi:tetratricopeptide (TPR) repeat protein
MCVVALVAVLVLGGCATRPLAGQGEPLRRQAEVAYEADQPAARALYEQLVQSDDAQAEDWFRLGNLRAQAGDLEAAAAAYRQALALDPELPPARHNLGMTYLQLGVNAILKARKGLPDVDAQAAASMRWLACIMEIFMGFPDPATCRDPVDTD